MPGLEDVKEGYPYKEANYEEQEYFFLIFINYSPAGTHEFRLSASADSLRRKIFSRANLIASGYNLLVQINQSRAEAFAFACVFRP